MLENVELVANYHNQKLFDIKQLFKSYNITSFDTKREPEITHYERFITMLIRAINYKKDILITTLFSAMPHINNIDDIEPILSKVESYIDSIIFLDFNANQKRYKGIYE